MTHKSVNASITISNLNINLFVIANKADKTVVSVNVSGTASYNKRRHNSTHGALSRPPIALNSVRETGAADNPELSEETGPAADNLNSGRKRGPPAAQSSNCRRLQHFIPLRSHTSPDHTIRETLP